jgi:hypothetical protein
MTNEQKYTSLADSKRLAEIGFAAEADSYWEPNPGNQEGYSLKDEACLRLKVWGGRDGWIIDPRVIPAFRLDTLQLKLPEWCSKYAENLIYGWRHYELEKLNLNSKVHKELTYWLNSVIINFKSEYRIKACVSLLILLKKEGVE